MDLRWSDARAGHATSDPHDLGLAAALRTRGVREKGRVVERVVGNVFAPVGPIQKRCAQRGRGRMATSCPKARPTAPHFYLSPLAGRGNLRRTSARVENSSRNTRARARAAAGRLFKRSDLAATAPSSRRRRYQLHRAPRREPGSRRRVRLRQVDDLHHGHASDRRDGRTHPVRRRGHRRHSCPQVRAAARAQAHPDGVSGPDRQPEPALHGSTRHRRSASAARPPRAQAVRSALRGAARRSDAPELLDAFRIVSGARRRRRHCRAIALSTSWSSDERPRRWSACKPCANLLQE